MSSAATAFLFAVLAGGPVHQAGPAAPARLDQLIELRVVFDEAPGRRLEGFQLAIPESSPSRTGYRLSEVTSAGSRPLAERVGAARYTPECTVLLVQDDALLELKDGRLNLVARPAEPDFALNPAGTLIALVRPAATGTSLDLLDRSGATLKTLASGFGWQGMPTFTPDASALIFASGRTGVASYFRVSLDGGEPVQLTNRGLKPGPDVLSQAYVPVAEGREQLRFVGTRLLEIERPEARFQVDLKTLEAVRAEVRR